MEIRVRRFQNYRDCGYTCNPHKFEIPALCRVPVNPCKHLQCSQQYKRKQQKIQQLSASGILHNFSGAFDHFLPSLAKTSAIFISARQILFLNITEILKSCRQILFPFAKNISFELTLVFRAISLWRYFGF